MVYPLDNSRTGQVTCRMRPQSLENSVTVTRELVKSVETSHEHVSEADASCEVFESVTKMAADVSNGAALPK